MSRATVARNARASDDERRIPRAQRLRALFAGGVAASLQQAYFSNSGDGLDIAAPGVGIQSAYGKNQIVLGDGTSQAAAITSGVVAYGLSVGATTTGTAAEWLAQNALPLGLLPESGGAGMTRIPSP